MKCKAKGCGLESRHIGKCSPVGPYAVVNSVVNKESRVVNNESKQVHARDVPDADDPVGERLEQAGVAEAGVGRQTQWQRKNKDRYNERLREYMKRKRAGKKPLGVPYG